MWSSGFVGATLSTDQAGTLTVLMWRFLVAAGLLGAWWAITRRRRLAPRDVALQFAIGLLSQGVYLLCVFYSAERGVSAGTVALVTALQPITVGALAGPVLGERTSGRQWAGLMLGIVGVGVVVSSDLAGGGEVPLWAYGLSALAMIALVTATLVERRVASSMALGDLLPIHCLSSAMLFGALAIVAGETATPTQPAFWTAIAWLVALSTIGGYGFYWLNLRLGGVTRVSSLIYLTPPTTMLWAFVMFGDALAPLAGAGMVICLAAVLLVRGAHVDDSAHSSQTGGEQPTPSTPSRVGGAPGPPFSAPAPRT